MLLSANKVSQQQQHESFPLLNYNSIMNTTAQTLTTTFAYSYVETSECFERPSMSISTLNTRDNCIGEVEQLKNRKKLATPEEIFSTASFRIKRRKSSFIQEDSKSISIINRTSRIGKSKLKLNILNKKKKKIHFAFGDLGMNLNSCKSEMKRKCNGQEAKSFMASETWNCIYLLTILTIVIGLSLLFIFVLMTACTDPINRLCYSLQ